MLQGLTVLGAGLAVPGGVHAHLLAPARAAAKAKGASGPLAFLDAHQFATIAHAAHNTQVPFMLLKHRVLVEGKSLVTAIRASKPELDEAAEAARAREAAAADLADIQV